MMKLVERLAIGLLTLTVCLVVFFVFEHQSFAQTPSGPYGVAELPPPGPPQPVVPSPVTLPTPAPAPTGTINGHAPPAAAYAPSAPRAVPTYPPTGTINGHAPPATYSPPLTATPSAYSPMSVMEMPSTTTTVSPPVNCGPCCPPAKFTESTWYTKVDYFHWNERMDGATLLNEDGPLYTLGYEHRYGIERVRFELFGGGVKYDGQVQYEDGSTEPLQSHTNYFGGRAEYDLLFEPDWSPNIDFFVGVGTQFWYRDLPDDYTASGDYVMGYQETWWTLYPYIGVEKRRDLTEDWEFFASARIGVTAFTYERVTLDDTQLYPRAGLLGNLEAGFRGKHFLLSIVFEEMSWAESPVNRGSVQPASIMYTVGLKTGFSF